MFLAYHFCFVFQDFSKLGFHAAFFIHPPFLFHIICSCTFRIFFQIILYPHLILYYFSISCHWLWVHYNLLCWNSMHKSDSSLFPLPLISWLQGQCSHFLPTFQLLYQTFLTKFPGSNLLILCKHVLFCLTTTPLPFLPDLFFLSKCQKPFVRVPNSLYLPHTVFIAIETSEIVVVLLLALLHSFQPMSPLCLSASPFISCIVGSVLWKCIQLLTFVKVLSFWFNVFLMKSVRCQKYPSQSL